MKKRSKIIIAVVCILLLIILALPTLVIVGCISNGGQITTGGEPCPPGLACVNDFQHIQVSTGECIKTNLYRLIINLPRDIFK
jgi:hypothetical protein